MCYIIYRKKIEEIKEANEHYKKLQDVEGENYTHLQIDIEKIKQDKTSLLYQYQTMFDYIESMDKTLKLDLGSYDLLSQIQESAIKILLDSNLRSVYDEDVVSKELNSLASYEDCVKYQQKVNERDSSIVKSEAVVEEVNGQQQIDLKNDMKVEKASVVRHVDISYSPSNTMTLLLSIYGGSGMKNISYVIRFNWPNLNISTEISSIKALEGPQKKLTSATSQNIQQQDNKKESNNYFSTFSNIKNWCYDNIIEPIVNFTGIVSVNNEFNSNLNINCDNEIEFGIPGRYTKTHDNIMSSADNEQTVNSQLYDVTIAHKLPDENRYLTQDIMKKAFFSLH